MCANRRRQAPRKHLKGYRGTRLQRHLGDAAPRLALEQHPGTLRVPETAGGEQRGGFGAEQNLARLRRMLHGDEAAPAGARRQQFDVRRADGKEMEFAGMHALRHPQRDVRTGNLDAADGAQDTAHQRRRTAGALDVAFALEPEQQRIAPELQQAAAVLVRDLEDRFETASDCLRNLLRALAALAGEPLRQLGETGDIDERGGAVARPVACFRVFEQVPLEDPGNVAPCMPDVRCGIVRLRLVFIRCRWYGRQFDGHGSVRSRAGVPATYDKRFTGACR